MRGTVPTLHCDHEDGCTEWTVDWYTLTADNWRDLMRGWKYDPYGDGDSALCSKHAGEPQPRPGEPRAMPKFWLDGFAEDGVPRWASLQAWDEASDEDTALQIKARARQIAASGDPQAGGEHR